MKLKYYLRGLGIGIAVTAVILHFSVYASAPVLTDEEIMERAQQLGMVEHTVSVNEPSVIDGDDPATGIEDGQMDVADGSDVSGDEQDIENLEGLFGTDEPDGEGEVSPEDSASENDSQDETHSDGNVSNENTPSADPAGEDYVPGDGQDEDREGNNTEEQSEGMTNNGEVQDSIVITVVSGDSSVSVAAKLAQAGLVSSVAAYDDYLCSNGYDKRICTGVHVIPVGASEREIAEIITTRQ